jgi:hypothetical protein
MVPDHPWIITKVTLDPPIPYTLVGLNFTDKTEQDPASLPYTVFRRPYGFRGSLFGRKLIADIRETTLTKLTVTAIG